MADRSLSIAEKEKAYKDAYARQDVNLLAMYERVMRTLNLQLNHLEEELTGGMNYKEGKLNPKLIKASGDIGRIVEKLTKLHLQIMKAEASAAQARSLEEKIEFAIRFICILPVGFRATALTKLGEDLLVKINRVNPPGRPAEGFIHPLDRQ